MQMIACSPETPRFPPPYHEIDVFEIQDKVIESILRDVEQQEAAALVNKPVAEEQSLASQVLQGHLNNAAFERGELRELRNFLKQPLVGASVQELRKALHTYSSTNDVRVLIETVRALYQHQAASSANGTGDVKSRHRITRTDLRLMCYEYVST